MSEEPIQLSFARLNDRYVQLVQDHRNLQESYRFDTNELRELLRYVAYQRLPLGGTVIETLDPFRQQRIEKILG